MEVYDSRWDNLGQPTVEGQQIQNDKKGLLIQAKVEDIMRRKNRLYYRINPIVCSLLYSILPA